VPTRRFDAAAGAVRHERAVCHSTHRAEQQRAAHPVRWGACARDLYFRIRSRGINHVGVYAGGGRFIHAPRAGLAVSTGSSGRSSTRGIWLSAGRFWIAAAVHVRHKTVRHRARYV